jgi:CheY-like chemotaxis protein
LQFFDAYSGPEAKAILSDEPDIALVFLDVVMETENSGLEVARWMCQDLKNQFVRIVLCTSQPGQAPEESVIVNFDINDDKEKNLIALNFLPLLLQPYAFIKIFMR